MAITPIDLAPQLRQQVGERETTYSFHKLEEHRASRSASAATQG
jgi:hypothetical protein